MFEHEYRPSARKQKGALRQTLLALWLALALLLPAQGALAAPAQHAAASTPLQDETPLAQLVGYAVLPADTFAEGPASGQFNGDGTKASWPRFPAQPVQGFSGIQFGPACGSYYLLSDNGFGSKYNSFDYLLRIYQVTPDPKTVDGGTGEIAVDDYIQLSDPAALIPFFIAREFSGDRLLTGADLDVESFVFDGAGSLWVGEEFGPYLLHFDAEGRLIDPPIPTPGFSEEVPTVQAPQNPQRLAQAPQPGQASAATLPTSRGFEGMARSADGMTLYPMLEGTVAGDPEGALRIHEFDVASKSYNETVRYYQLDDPTHAIGDFTVINDGEFLVIERDGKQGDEAVTKKIYKINLGDVDENGFVSKELVVDLLNIADPNNLAGYGEVFRFPFVTIEDVLVLDPNTIVVLNDNNYDARGGRGADVKDPNEMLVLRLAAPLDVAEGVGIPAGCLEPAAAGEAAAGQMAEGAGVLADLQGFQLQILHSSDNESAFQDPNTLEPKILHYGAVLEGLQELAEGEGMASIYLTAGDHTLPGPFYQAAAEVDGLGAPGLADIAFYNAMGLAANGIGNHEFDGGINDFAGMLADAAYPFIAVNLDFSQVQLEEGVPPIEIGQDGGSVVENAGKVVKSAYVEADGEKIGIIGRAPADFFNVIADPATTMPGLDFFGGRNPENNQPNVSAVEQVLEQVDLLESQDIDKIILLDHAQDFTGDPLAANLLRGIDVIVAAGTTGFMARQAADGPFNLLRDGDTPGAEYPTIRRDMEGNPVLVVNSDQLYSYVGNLMVTFDDAGRVMMVDPRSGPVASTEAATAALADVLGHEVAPAAEVAELYQALENTALIQEQFEVIGTTASELNGQRADVRSRETNLGRLAADSTLWYARKQYPDLEIDVALKNGGGIRAPILGPNITKLTVGTALAFDNKLAVVELTGAELLAVMENAVSRVPALDGRFPQVAGMQVEYDASREGISDQLTLDTPSRIKTLAITRANGEEDVLVQDYTLQGDPGRTFRLATNDFLLTGGDGYQALKAASEARGAERPDLGERQVLIEYIQSELGGNVDLGEPLAAPRVVLVDE